MKPLILLALLALAACDPTWIVFHAIDTTVTLSQPGNVRRPNAPAP